jgi:hypothetical protein
MLVSTISTLSVISSALALFIYKKENFIAGVFNIVHLTTIPVYPIIAVLMISECVEVPDMSVKISGAELFALSQIFIGALVSILVVFIDYHTFIVAHGNVAFDYRQRIFMNKND